MIMTHSVDEWSWSRINSFRQGLEGGDGCLYGWYLTYRLNERGDGNFFMEYGLLFHNMIERIGKGELFPWEIEDELERGISGLQYDAPYPAMRESYLNKLRNFFYDSFEERFKKYKFIESEAELHFELNGHKIRGYVDLIAKHDDYGFIIVDFKSSRPYTGAKLENNIMQLYMYSIGIRQKYERYPEYLMYYYFKEPKKEYAYKFSMDELDRTKEFVIETIEISKNYVSEEQFRPRCLDVPDDDFYCLHLCSHRFNCKYSKLKQNEKIHIDK